MGAPAFSLRLAGNDEDRTAAFRLRHEVFVRELGAEQAAGSVAELETDAFDPYCDHLLLLDERRPAGDRVVGVSRMLRESQARSVGFYSEEEYDIGVLRRSDRRLMELGRSCLHPAYRGGTAMYELWSGLGAYVDAHRIDLIFGVASFHGTDLRALAEPLSILHHRHLAPPDVRVTARPPGAVDMAMIDERSLDRARAMRAVPALIKAYLKLGGWVGEGAFVDRTFNTVDVCLVLDTARMNRKQSALYGLNGPA